MSRRFLCPLSPWLAICAILAPMLLSGCQEPQQGRDWRLHDTRTEYRSTEFFFQTERQSGKDGREIVRDLGCLAVYTTVGVHDNVDTWRIYEADDWRISEIGSRSSTRFLISDPPGQQYPGVTDRAHPESVPAAVREPSGLLEEPLNLATYPIKVSWQVVMGDGRSWIEDSNDINIALSGSRLISEGTRSDYAIQLCDQELRRLQTMPAEEFAVMFRLEATGWPSGMRKPLRKDFYLRERITRDLIRAQLSLGKGGLGASSEREPEER